MDYKISIEKVIDEADKNCIISGLKQHNEGILGKQEFTPVNLLLKDGDRIIGGLNATVVWGWLVIDNLFVDREYRGKGLGGVLLQTALNVAIKMGINKASIGTILNDTIEICSRYGFTVDGVLQDRPKGYNYHFLKNDLVEEAKIKEIEYKLIDDISQEDSKTLHQMIEEDKKALLGEIPFKEVKLMARNDEGKIVGGIIGYLGWCWLYISALWVDEEYRGRDIGQRLVIAAEEEAKASGIDKGFLGTTDFQAKGFYEKLGYEVLCVTRDLPPGYCNFTMKKVL